METRLYVGNLPFSATDDELKQAFSAHGTVTDVALISDRVTGRSRGFAFVTMSTPEEANAAVAGMHGKDHAGRSLTVNIARPREERPARGGGGGYGGGYRPGYRAWHGDNFPCYRERSGWWLNQSDASLCQPQTIYRSAKTGDGKRLWLEECSHGLRAIV